MDDFLQFPTPFKIYHKPLEAAEPNFLPYDIFLLTNRLKRIINNTISSYIDYIFFPADNLENGVIISTDLYIRLHRGVPDKFLTKKDIPEHELLAKSIEELFKDKITTALIWTSDNKRPIGWVAGVIKTLPVLLDYYFSVEITDDEVLFYSAFKPKINYINLADKLYNHIEQYLDYCWNKGTIFVPSEDVEYMSQKWKLKSIGSNEDGHILQAPWTIFDNMPDWNTTGFLLSRLNTPDEPLELNIGTNLIIHSGIAKELHQQGFIIHFDDSQVFVNVTDYEQLMLVNACQQRAQGYSGKILYLSATTTEEQQKQIQALSIIAGPSNMNRKGEIITLRRINSDESYVTLVNIEGQLHHDQLKSLIKSNIHTLTESLLE